MASYIILLTCLSEPHRLKCQFSQQIPRLRLGNENGNVLACFCCCFHMSRSLFVPRNHATILGSLNRLVSMFLTFTRFALVFILNKLNWGMKYLETLGCWHIEHTSSSLYQKAFLTTSVSIFTITAKILTHLLVNFHCQ